MPIGPVAWQPAEDEGLTGALETPRPLDLTTLTGSALPWLARDALC